METTATYRPIVKIMFLEEISENIPGDLKRFCRHFMTIINQLSKTMTLWVATYEICTGNFPMLRGISDLPLGLFLHEVKMWGQKIPWNCQKKEIYWNKKYILKPKNTFFDLLWHFLPAIGCSRRCPNTTLFICYILRFDDIRIPNGDSITAEPWSTYQIQHVSHSYQKEL